MSKKLCFHGRKICYDCAQVSDSAKRMYNIIQGYVAFVPHDERVNSWVAIRLSDGGHDGNLYTSRADAVRHQVRERDCFYFTYRDSPNGMANEKEAQVLLDWVRAANEQGRMPDPDSGMDLIMPMRNEHIIQQLAEMGVKNRSIELDQYRGK